MTVSAVLVAGTAGVTNSGGLHLRAAGDVEDESLAAHLLATVDGITHGNNVGVVTELAAARPVTTCSTVVSTDSLPWPAASAAASGWW